MARVVIKDGVRYPEAFAERHKIKADETREVGDERVRVRQAPGFPQVAVDDVSGAVITSAGQDGANEAEAAEAKTAADKAAEDKGKK